MFNKIAVWVKRTDPRGSFDLTVRTFDSAVICDVLDLFILDTLGKEFFLTCSCLHRDDTFPISTRGVNSGEAQEHLAHIYISLRLRTAIEKKNLAIINSLDLGAKPFCKSNEKLIYASSASCPPSIKVKNLVKYVSKSISHLWSCKGIFDDVTISLFVTWLH